jgi:hypothetical protein
MTTLESLKQQAIQLTLMEQDALLQFLQEQQAKDEQQRANGSASTNGSSSQTNASRLRESKWLSENWVAYLGQFVCLEGNQLISSGTDPHQVYAQAKAAGIASPFMARVQDPNIAYVDGFVAI